MSVSALRFLEREGLLSPIRKPGGHRLYSEDDLNRARRIKQWQSQRYSLSEIRERLELSDRFKQQPAADKLEKMLLALDIVGAGTFVAHLHDAGMPLVEVCDRVLTPALQRMATADGQHLIPVDAQVEFDEWLSRFLGKVASPPPGASGKPVVVAACPPWERHDLALRMLSALLIERGADVHFLGAQLELEFLLAAIDRLDPGVVLISLSTAEDMETMVPWLDRLATHLSPGRRLVVGGPVALASAVAIQRIPSIVNHGDDPLAEVLRLILSAPQ